MASESSAPSRTPAISFGDSKQSYFRAWALRSSEHEHSDPSSTSSTPISPKTVPKTVRAKKASYQSQYSEASQLTEGTREPLSAPWRRAHTLGSGGNPQLTLTKPSAGRLPITLGGRAQKLLRIHARDSADSTKPAADSTASPSEESKDEWKWEISGHWFQIRIGRNRRSEGDELGVKTIKGKMLNRTSSILRPLAERNGTPPNLSASDSMNGPGSNRSLRNRISRLLPFHHRLGSSNSRSIRDSKMADAPQGTPEPHALYTGSDKEQYFQVESSDLDAPTFLPSEARRIAPLVRVNTVRGFFDYASPSSPDAPDGSHVQVRRPRLKRNDVYRAEMHSLKSLGLDVEEHFEYPSAGKGVYGFTIVRNKKLIGQN